MKARQGVKCPRGAAARGARELQKRRRGARPAHKTPPRNDRGDRLLVAGQRGERWDFRSAKEADATAPGLGPAQTRTPTNRTFFHNLKICANARKTRAKG